MLSRKLKGLLVLAALIGASQGTQAQTVTAAMAAPAGSINTNKPGFKVRVFKGNSRINPNAVAPAELIISGLAIDPGTGVSLVNTADLNPNEGPFLNTFFYELPGYINQHEQSPNDPAIAGGNFSPTQTQAQRIRNEEPVPGMIPGSDYYVVEYTGYMQLPNGTHRFGVNSDDGFRLTFGAGLDPYALPGTLPTAGVQAAVLDGTRGFGNTEANVVVNAAGIYPFRLIYWESTGANSGVEFYNFTPATTTGNIYLVNDTNVTQSFKTYAYANVQPLLVSGRYPISGATGVEALPFVKAIIDDGASPLDPASVVMKTDGVALSTTITKDLLSSLIVAQPANPFLPNTLHTNSVEFADAAGNKYTNSWTFTIANYPVVPASYSVGAVDTNKPGFRVKVHQMDFHKAPQTSLAYTAERQIANGFNDPATGLPFPNTANLTGPIDDINAPGTPIVGTETLPAADAEGYFIDEDVINYGEAAGGQGNFLVDELTPGVSVNYDPATAAPRAIDRYVVSVEGILELKAGFYRFGVNSDDGCRLTFGRGPGEVTGTQVLVANADRGPTDTFGDVQVLADGFYPFRMMYWETGGGSEGEFFVQNYQTLNKYLVNTTDETANPVVKSYRESTNTPPHITRLLPVVNEAYVFADADVTVEITERSIPLGTAILRVNNVEQTVAITKTGSVTTVKRVGSVTTPLPSGTVTFACVYDYTPAGGSLTTVTNTWTGVVPPYTRLIPPANRVQLSEVSDLGLKWNKNVQIDRSGDANQGNGGRYVMNGGGGNNMPGPEIELQGGYLRVDGTPYPNLAPADDGVISSFLNFNWTPAGTGNSGLFNTDVRGPGLPGTGTSNAGLDNSVHEIFTYLDLKKGAHILGVNVDDGWYLTSSPNPSDTLGTLLGFKNAPGGNAGFPLNNPNAALTVLVPEDGIYPMRLLFWEGGGGVNIEFAAVDRNTGVLSLIGDESSLNPPAQPAAPQPPSTKYVAYANYSGTVRPWTKFSVYPMRNDATLYQNPIQASGPGPMTIRVGAGNPADIANDNINTRPFGDAVGAIVADLGAGTVGMVLNGNPVTPTVTDIPSSTDKLVMYVPDPPLAGGSTNTAGLIYAGTTNYWTFIVIANTNAPLAAMKPVSSADQAKKGFQIKVAQSATARANTVAAAETQLTNAAVNVAIPGPLDGGFYQADIINFNNTKNAGGTPADTGNFTPARSGQADAAFPGIPGTGLSSANANSRENFTLEIFAYLDLPKGYQKFGFNADDGWAVKIGTPGDPTGTVLFSADRGAGNRDIPFAFVTPEAGLYPIRVTYYQGGGGGNAEFFTYGPNNSKNLVNDLANPNSVKAYYGIIDSSAPQIIGTALTGGNITFTWTGGGELETANDVLGPWNGTGNSTGSASLPAGTGNAYYRVKRL